ncbi:MAG: epimerase [Candidatus Zambryskibacteria bacterium RIFCSPLOWO2_01_FULL_39_39]|uniref:Nucleoside-diphosphate-sugar epimerase n=2 Tax=Patescibacteria group TaxID=1783273 RepID=A0A0G0EN30_9BACT|nr:MAG: Nucleoside-diphosphate-sugar epimerase [Candidatus Daviesbacteria bacterium GW2011_GWB1_36_5]OHA87535.1 MAG: epimerase [Candidatus Zambryskibacteria bacterium RIFCSPHIGHO2_01_FULL_39_63]OHA95063.1 MAG: epimerase [Candidatus Zambryskibacteria bacterium RIFCSPHIGHO2_02_FULL_39_19]OHA98183.1 MAG: epimerase [Candidatus Zambryskibacteria bacterium RIFCSPHIGHO2_12_FULL_39_21]OHB02451.1 MAG: epimerase [Candidatus Zambryskibacteria bacterium RIFCSPLOWO2_01_FULL_39_39]
MTYFITGGSGFLGINMVRFLLKNGHEIISYDLLPFDYPEKNKVRWVMGDIRNLEFLTESMKGTDIVIHMAAALPLYKAEDIRTTDIDGTRNVCQAAKDNGIQRVIHISSTAVYGIPDHHPLYETDKLDGVGEYGKAKIAAEKICLDFRKKGMIVSILRPKSFIGPERLGVFALFYDWASTGHGFPMIGFGHNRYQLMDVEDFCDGIYLCSTLEKEKVNDMFNFGAKEFTTMREDYQAVLDYAGFGKKIKGFPASPMIWILRVLEALHLSPLYKWVYETASRDSFVSIEKAQKILGWNPKYSNKDALIRNYEWYLSHRSEFKGKSGVNHRVPWKQGVLSLAKIFF